MQKQPIKLTLDWVRLRREAAACANPSLTCLDWMKTLGTLGD